MYQCKVWLDNYTGQYYPGSVIQGKVICNFDSETTVRGIKIRVKGEEHTEWLGEEKYFDSTENRETTRETLFVGDNDVYQQQIMLFGNESNTSTIGQGQHFYPFSVILPTALPSSYSCPYGSIIYKIIAIVDRPMRQDYQDVAMFILQSPIDLNKLGPAILQPSSYSEDKTICCFCCASGPISLDAEVTKQALIPGETVNVNVRLSNMSNVNVESVTLEITESLTYTTLVPKNDTKSVQQVLATISNTGVGAHGDSVFDFKLELPSAIFIPNFEQCKLFEAKYHLNLKAELPSYHSNIAIPMAVTLGNIAVGSTNNMQNGGNGQPQAAFIQPVGPYPPGAGPYPAPAGGAFGPPMGGGFPPPSNQYPGGPQPAGPNFGPPMGAYPPPGAQNSGGPYGPPMGAFPPPTGQNPAGAYGPPPTAGSGGYPPTNGNFQPYPGGPPPQNMGYPPAAGSGYPAATVPNAPSAPMDGNSKAQEAAQQNKPNTQDLPPPSYDSLHPK